MDQNNPLKQYFRQFKSYIRLPSGTNRYPNGVVKFTESGEVGIMPMTGKDEIILKNPDALLNGEAVVEVIKSCVPAVTNPAVLLSNDINALITAIRQATYNDKLEIDANCPSCGKSNHYKLDLQYPLTNMSYLEDEYSITLSNNLRVIVRPYGYKEMVQSLQSKFEQSRVARMLEDEKISEEERVRIFGSAIKKMTGINFDMLATSIESVVNDSDGMKVTNPTHIKEFLVNIEKKDIDKIKNLIEEINNVGVKNDFNAICEHCKHEWTNEIEFNPVNFS